MIKGVIEELKNKQVEAAEMADSEAVKVAQVEIEELQKQQTKIQNTTQQTASEEDAALEVKWEKDNDWLNGNDPKAVYARSVAQNSLHLTGQAFIDAIEAQVSAHFPPVNQNRQRPSMTDKASSRTVKSERPTMSSLNQEERKMWSALSGNKHMTESKFLKMVENSRKGV